MPGFFPTDVRVEIEGDPSSQILGAARNVLFKTLQRAAVAGASHLVTRAEINGNLIEASIEGPIKTVRIISPKVEPKQQVPEPPVAVQETAEGAASFGMLTGWVRSISPFEWKPTSYCARAWNLKEEWQNLTRLAPNATAMYSIKPSTYTGVMKRWVQAIFGMGTITDRSPTYLTGKAPTTPTRVVPMTYTNTGDETHGIIKAGTKNHWLVRVGKKGVHAMPLPILSSTTTRAYRERIALKGDLGTLRVLDEFGGLPSGENFPTAQVDFDYLVNIGKVIELIPAATMVAELYSVPAYVRPVTGWAFAETTSEAHNTFHRVLDKNGVMGESPGASEQYLNFEHWGIDISLSPHDVTNLTRRQPVGYGSAVLTKHAEGKVDPHGIQALMRGTAGVDGILPFAWSGYPTAWTYFRTPNPAGSIGWGATVYLYFDGDRLIKVGHAPAVRSGYIDGVGEQERSTFGAEGLSFPGNTGKIWRQPNWYGTRYSSAGFISPLSDWRINAQDTPSYVAPFPPTDNDAWASWTNTEWSFNPSTAPNVYPPPAVAQYGGSGGFVFQAEQAVFVDSMREGYCHHRAFGSWVNTLDIPGQQDSVYSGEARFFAGSEGTAVEIEDRPVSAYPAWSRPANGGSYQWSGYLLMNAYSTFHFGNWMAFADGRILQRATFSAAFEATRTEGVIGMITYRGNPSIRYSRIDLPTGMTEVTTNTVNWTGSHYAP